MTKFNIFKEIVLWALIGFILYDRLHPKPITPEKIVTIIRDTITTKTVTTKPVIYKKQIRIDTFKSVLPIENTPDSFSTNIPQDASLPIVTYVDTVDIHPNVRIFTEHDASNLIESRYKADINFDTVVTYIDRPCPRLPYLSFYAFSQISNSGSSIGVAIIGRKILSGYSYDMIQKSHQITLGYRLGGF